MNNMKEVYIYGAHVKVGYSKKYSAFEDIAHEGMSKGKTGIWDLVHDKPKQKFEWVDDGALKHVPYGMGDRTLARCAECRRGKPKFRGIPGIVGYELWDRLMLMNDEVTWQWRTGSDLTYRFETIAEAKDFFTWILMHRINEVKTCSADAGNFRYRVGDRVRLLDDVAFTWNDLDCESKMLAFGMTLPKEVVLKKGTVVRVFDVDADGLAISPIDNVTAFRVPRTGGAKVVYGSKTFLPFDVVELVKRV